MRKSLFKVLGVTAALGTALLTTTAASAAPHSRAGPATTCPSLTGCGTTVTFTISTGALAITVPSSADLGLGTPGGYITNNLGGLVTVTDDRAELAAAWTATVSSTDFTNTTTPGATPIPAGAATYSPGVITTAPSTATAINYVAPGGATAPFTLSNTAQPVVVGTGIGDNAANWDPVISVTVPPAAFSGGYTSVLTQSVS